MKNVNYQNFFNFVGPRQRLYGNTVLKIFQNDREDFKLFECKSFLYEIDRDNIKDIKFEDHFSEPDLNCLKLRLRNNYKIEFEELNPLTEEKACKYNNCFPHNILDNKNCCIVAVLVKDLNSFKLDSPIDSLNDPNCVLYHLVSKCSGLKYFTHKLVFPDHFIYQANIINLFPKNCIFTVSIKFEYVQSFI